MKFSIDYSNLDKKLNKKAFLLSEVQDKIEKVAFDIVKFKDKDDAANLWQICNADDGETYIVSLYEDSDQKTALASAPLWDIKINKLASTIQISYKNDPLVSLPASKLGIPNQELASMTKYLPKKLAENKKLVKLLLNEMSDSAKKQVLSKYPELV
jgi:hypothetical protein